MTCAIKVLTNYPVHVSQFPTWFDFRWYSSGPSLRIPVKSAPMCTGPVHLCRELAGPLQTGPRSVPGQVHVCRELARTRETRPRRVRACQLGAHVYRRPAAPACTADVSPASARRAPAPRTGAAGARPPHYLPESGNSMLTVVPRPTRDASVTRSPIFWHRLRTR